MSETPVHLAYLRGQVEHFENLFAECQLARDSAGYIGSVPECIQTMNLELMDAYRSIAGIWKALDDVNAGIIDGADLDAAIYEAVDLLPPTMREGRAVPPKKLEREAAKAAVDQFEELLG